MYENNGFLFHLEDNGFIAELVDYLGTDEKIIIPKSILYDSNEYIVNVISVESINTTVKTVSFERDSRVKTIGDLSSLTKLESLNIPSSVSKFSIKWCLYLKNLVNISISPQNPYLS